MGYGYTSKSDFKGFSNDHPLPPEIEVDNPYLQRRIARLEAQTDQLCARAAGKMSHDKGERQAFERWRKASLSFLKQWPSGWAWPEPEVALKMKNTNDVELTNFAVQS